MKRDPKKTGRVTEGHGIVDHLPEPYVTVLVHTEAHTCQGYLDPKGIWRSPFTDQPIGSRVIAWEPI